MAFSHSWPAKYLLPCAFSCTDSSLAPMFEYYQIRYVEFSKSLCPKNDWVKIMKLGKFLQDRCWLILGPIFQPTVRASFSGEPLELLLCYIPQSPSKPYCSRRNRDVCLRPWLPAALSPCLHGLLDSPDTQRMYLLPLVPAKPQAVYPNMLTISLL